jgi:hypothetical protein
MRWHVLRFMVTVLACVLISTALHCCVVTALACVLTGCILHCLVITCWHADRLPSCITMWLLRWHVC